MTHFFFPRHLSYRAVVFLMFMISSVPVMAQPDNSFERSARGRFLGLHQAVELALTTHPLLHEGTANLKASEARTRTGPFPLLSPGLCGRQHGRRRRAL